MQGNILAVTDGKSSLKNVTVNQLYNEANKKDGKGGAVPIYYSTCNADYNYCVNLIYIPMTEQYYVNQIVLLSLDTDIDLTTATLPKVAYTRPNGTKGTWNGSINTDKVEYLTGPTDLNIKGDWKFQAVVTKDGGEKVGAVSIMTVKER